MESIPSRVNHLEQKSHTHEHRITVLEQLAPRVGDVEASVKAMNVALHHIEASNAEIKSGMKTIVEQHSQWSGEVSGFIKAAKAFGAIITIFTLADLITRFFG